MSEKDTAVEAEAEAADAKTVQTEELIRVRATRKGFYLSERTPDDRPFTVPESRFSKNWMEKVDDDDNASATEAGTSKENEPPIKTDGKASTEDPKTDADDETAGDGKADTNDGKDKTESADGDTKPKKPAGGKAAKPKKPAAKKAAK